MYVQVDQEAADHLKNIIDLTELIMDKFQSGNDIKVERITLTRKEVEEFLII